MTTAWLYARKSKYRRRKSDPDHLGRSVADQLVWSRTHAAEQEWAVGDEYIDDSRSASRYQADVREEYERLLADIAAGRVKRGDVVVCWESSRLQRDLAVYVQLRDTCWHHGILWCWGGRLYDLSQREDRLMTGLDALLGEDEVEQLRARVLRATRSNATAGRPHGPGTYGYRRLYDPDTGDLLEVVIVEEQAEIIREIFERVAAGQALMAIADDLESRGVPSPLGGPWGRGQVRRIAMNRAYIGERMHCPRGGEPTYYPAVWQPILRDAALLYRAQALLTDPRRRFSKDGAIKHLLSGIAICDVCKTPVRTRKNGGYRLYACVSNGPDGKGFHVGRAIWKVDEVVEAVLFERFSRKDAVEWIGTDNDDVSQMQAARDEVTVLRARMDEHYDKAATGGLTADGLAAMETRLLPKIKAAERRVESLRTPPSMRGLIKPTPAEVEAVWRAMHIPEQREIIRHLLEVRICRVGKGHRDISPQESVIVRRRPRASVQDASVKVE